MTTKKKAPAKTAKLADKAFNAAPDQGKYPKGAEPLPAALKETADGKAGPVTKLADPQPVDTKDENEAEHTAVRRANFG